MHRERKWDCASQAPANDTDALVIVIFKARFAQRLNHASAPNFLDSQANYPMLQAPPDFEATVINNAELPCIDLFFRGHDLLVDDGGERLAERDDALIAAAESNLIVGRRGAVQFRAHRVAGDTQAPHGSRFAGLRALFGSLPAPDLFSASLGNQLLEWDRAHAFCGACATPTVRDAKERSRRCPACGLSAYPRISPAMMCLVTRGKEILLARNVNFPQGRYSALAGFLEAGESIEDAVHREVREEVGVSVKNLRYFASQSWPFPNSLMIAFTAEYAGGEVTPNGHEIAEAAWFDANHLPQLPPRLSIARALIDETLHQFNIEN
jgi:NAD+ diphosphatase